MASAGKSGRSAVDGAQRADSAGRTSSRRRPGRPALVSREFVIDAVIAMLDRDPRSSLTLANIAREAGVVPTALYRHFEGLDDILDCVVSRALCEPMPPLDPAAPWQTRLASTLRELRERLRRHPAVLELLGGPDRASPAWLAATTSLLEILEFAGLRDRELAIAFISASELVTAIAAHTVGVSLREHIVHGRVAMLDLDPRGRALFERVGDFTADLDDDAVFEFLIESFIAQVSALARIGKG